MPLGRWHPHSALCSCLALGPRRGKVYGVSTSTSPRRIGTEDSKTRAQLLDAAEPCCSRRDTPRSPHAGSRRGRVSSRSSSTTTSARWTTSSVRSSGAVPRRTWPGSSGRRRPTARCVPLGAQLRPPGRGVHAPSSSRWRTTARTIRDEIATYAERYRAAQLEAVKRRPRRSRHPRRPAAADRGTAHHDRPVPGDGPGGAHWVSPSGHDTTLAFIEQAIDQIESSPLADDGAGSGGRS